MSGLLGYLSVLADDIGSLAGRTMSINAKTLATSLDDIGLLFDDIATYTKLAGVKSSGILIDDLAAIANFTNETTSDILKRELQKARTPQEFEQNINNLDEASKKTILEELENLRNLAILEAKRKAAQRELPIVYKIAKGSLINKFIIIPTVLFLSYLAPWAIAPILILGGIFLAYEGVHSLFEKFSKHAVEEKVDDDSQKFSNEELENNKIKSAIKTDFILSFEIIVISLSLLGNLDFVTKLFVLIFIGILTTIFVYGIVALIIKLDDIGFYLQEKNAKIVQKIGDGFVKSMPYIIRAIGILGTVAMLAVGGGIVTHETGVLSSYESMIKVIPLGGFVADIILGVIIGFITLVIVQFITKIVKKVK
ncbi:Protein of unknown function DUF808 [Sulfurimonas denitrificans DSM 1251]|uniref:DUF808 domain-containing protein n=1 Tax=Sulfurimonas denitrificans (strain ATCC 33889 / DSM 1251) TaxID=326298 RepID=Q30TH0_SULDN|nr:DUF808 family protein [Sulfurimonas denitrificans]ABB43711.1 Protein of unknown function DUF808 [Sulfurimonas denitrificans DSM 1251]MDD3442734.1 DUF808 family protein [Sulfurimonas denitrificans]